MENPPSLISLMSLSLDFHFMNPVVLSEAYVNLNFLQHRIWIDACSIDLWLLDMWRTLSHPRFRYLPTFFVPPVAHGEVTREETDHFRSFFPSLPPADMPCPYENVVYVLNTGPDIDKPGNHFCVVAFLPSSRVIYVIGRRFNANQANYYDKDWAGWDGHRIWTRICALFGWDLHSETLTHIRLCSVDWMQNGYDCGPIACQVAQHLMQNGLRMDGALRWKQPRLPCCHPLRRKMAERIDELIWNGFHAFQALDAEEIREMDPTLIEIGTDLMITLRTAFDLDPTCELRKVIQSIDKGMKTCQRCHAMLAEIEEARAAAICPVPVRRKTMKDAGQARNKELLKGTKSMAALVMGEETTAEIDSTGDKDEIAHPDSPEPEENSEAFVVGDWTQARIGRFPRPKTGPKIPPLTSLRGRQLPFKAQFDDYYDDGPTMEDLHPVPQEIMGYDTSLVYLANRVTSMPWTLFKDYGYRLLPNFAQNFYLGKPYRFKEHLCPVGLADPPDSITAYQAERVGRYGATIEVNDLLHVGAEELLDLATAEGDDTILLTGKTLEGDHVLLDLQRDAVKPKTLLYSCDIDSLIWITQTPRILGPFGIYASPLIRDKAPIWKNNHVRVELLFPQSDEDREAGGKREEWWTKPFSLSNIPHLLFGLLHQGSPAVDILLFFPRMTHKHPYTHYSETLIPKHIQEILWDRVILPSIKAVLPETAAVYFPLDRAHSRFKQGLGKGNITRTPLHVLQGSNMEEIMENMKLLVSQTMSSLQPIHSFIYVKIQEGGDSLVHFRSFFFVLQIKGSKRLTHSQEPNLSISAKEAMNNFKRCYTGLDWDYMNIPKHGQLVCDVGITVQPENSMLDLVGLWRLDCLEASYGAGGYLTGNIHSLNTLAMYGGLQAESPSWRSKESHICFRSSYNLAYEATRQHDNSRDLFQERHVFNRDPWFQHQFDSVKEIYDEKAPEQSYGVRDEFRISGRGVEELIKCVDDSVRIHDLSRMMEG